MAQIKTDLHRLIRFICVVCVLYDFSTQMAQIKTDLHRLFIPIKASPRATYNL